MKIRMMVRPGTLLLLIAVASIPLIKQRFDEGNSITAVILVFCALYVIYMATLTYKVISFDKDKITVIHSCRGVPCKKRVIIPCSEYSYIYFATIKENNKSSKWIILCPQEQKFRRINTKDLMGVGAIKDSVIAFKYSQKREAIILKTFEKYVDIIVEHMEVDNISGQRTVHSSSKISQLRNLN